MSQPDYEETSMVSDSDASMLSSGNDDMSDYSSSSDAEMSHQRGGTSDRYKPTETNQPHLAVQVCFCCLLFVTFKFSI